MAILKGCDYAKREELVSAFRQTIDDNLKSGSVIVAGGLAVYAAEEDRNYNDVFKRADRSMYEQKRTLKALLDSM